MVAILETMKKIKISDTFGTDFKQGQEITLYENLEEVKLHYPEVSLNEQAKIMTCLDDTSIVGFIQASNFEPKEPEFIQLWANDFEEVVV